MYICKQQSFWRNVIFYDTANAIYEYNDETIKITAI